MNYFKPLNEIIEDFNKLSVPEMQDETSIMLSRYIRQSKSDISIIGEITSQTKGLWELYETLTTIVIKKAKEKSNTFNCPCCGKDWNIKLHNACECGATVRLPKN